MRSSRKNEQCLPGKKSVYLMRRDAKKDLLDATRCADLMFLPDITRDNLLIFVAEYGSIRMIAIKTGQVVTYAGSSTELGFVKGALGISRFVGEIESIAIDNKGDMDVILDSNSLVIRSMNLTSGMVHTVANGNSQNSDSVGRGHSKVVLTNTHRRTRPHRHKQTHTHKLCQRKPERQGEKVGREAERERIRICIYYLKTKQTHTACMNHATSLETSSGVRPLLGVPHPPPLLGQQHYSWCRFVHFIAASVVSAVLTADHLAS